MAVGIKQEGQVLHVRLPFFAAVVAVVRTRLGCGCTGGCAATGNGSHRFSVADTRAYTYAVSIIVFELVLERVRLC